MQKCTTTRFSVTDFAPSVHFSNTIAGMAWGNVALPASLFFVLAAAQSSTISLFLGDLGSDDLVASVVTADSSQAVYAVACASPSPIPSDAVIVNYADICSLGTDFAFTITAAPGPTPTSEQYA